MILVLIALRGFPLWLVGVVLLRDVLIIAGGSLLIGRRRVVLSSNWLGKATTLFMALLIFAWTLEWQRAYGLLTAAVLVFLVSSTTSYGIAMHRQLHLGGQSEPTEPAAVAGRCAGDEDRR
jgi:phosphatidylglycerophosphate synthase